MESQLVDVRDSITVPRSRCAPSPRWGEGWGEGVRSPSRDRNPSSHPSPNPTRACPSWVTLISGPSRINPTWAGRGCRPSLRLGQYTSMTPPDRLESHPMTVSPHDLAHLLSETFPHTHRHDEENVVVK